MNKLLVVVGGAVLLVAATLAMLGIREGGTNCGTAFGNNSSSDFASVLRTNSLTAASKCEDARNERRTLVLTVGAFGLVLAGSGGVLLGRAAAERREPQRVR